MDEISTKAIIIGVAITVTLLIVTTIILEFNEISKIYKSVSETEVSFESRLNELDKFRDSNNIFYGIDVKNTWEKYKNDKTVVVCFKGHCTDGEGENRKFPFENEDEYYNKKYQSNIVVEHDIYRITFEEK